MSYYYKKTLTLLLLMFGFQSITAQTLPANNSIETNNKDIGKLKVLKINTSGYSLDLLGELKDELIAWKEKVRSIDINENTKEFTLVHYLTMDNRELFDVLYKYNIQKNSIISYQ